MNRPTMAPAHVAVTSPFYCLASMLPFQIVVSYQFKAKIKLHRLPMC